MLRLLRTALISAGLAAALVIGVGASAAPVRDAAVIGDTAQSTEANPIVSVEDRLAEPSPPTAQQSAEDAQSQTVTTTATVAAPDSTVLDGPDSLAATTAAPPEGARAGSTPAPVSAPSASPPSSASAQGSVWGPVAPESSTFEYQAPGLAGSSITGMLSDWLIPLTSRAGSADPYYWSGESFITGSESCFRCTSGPAVLSAVDAALTGDAGSRAAVTSFMNKSIREHQGADGSFGPAAAGEGSNDIQTVFFGMALSETYLLIGDSVTPLTAANWRTSISGAADYLIRNGNLSWYTNGNIVLANAAFIRFAAMITKRADYDQAATRAFNFALHPDATRWPGRGLFYSVEPSLPDGSDGAGYLTETGAGGTGLDTDYLTMQADLAGWLYVFSGRPEALSLLNVLTNQLLSKLDVNAWVLETGGGTRHMQPSRPIPFASASILVLATSGHRPDLQPLVESYVTNIDAWWRSSSDYASPGLSYAFGLQAALSAYVLGTR